MLTAETLHVETGAPVVALDGKHLGKVKEVRDIYFKVDARWRRDYWLTTNEVMSADANQALLLIPSDEVNLYKMDRPGHDGLGRMGNEPDLSAHRRNYDRELMGR